MFFRKDPSKLTVPAPEDTLPGRSEAVKVPAAHHVHARPLTGPFPEGFRRLVLGMGCFWGAERKFWTEPGVHTTAVGYAGGSTPNPTYKEVCSGATGHTEVVLVVYDPSVTTASALCKVFWESHDPTQGMRQGNDVGTQYRSALFHSDADQAAEVETTRAAFQAALSAKGLGEITTEIGPEPQFYYAEDYHQQYLSKNPAGYCGLGGTGAVCPVGLPT